jgi:PAS domain S-box-containing protein
MPEPRGQGWESQRLRQVLDQLTDAVVAVDRDFCIVYANAVALKMVGRRLAEVVGLNHWELLPQLRNTIVWDEYHRALETGTPTQFEYRSSLSGKWLEARAFPSEDGMVFHLSDITDRKLADEERTRREAVTKAMIDAMPQIAWTADLSGNANYFNARWYTYTGLTRDDSYRPANVIHPEDLDRILNARTRAYEAGRTYETEVRIRRADGEYRWHLTRAEPMRAEDGEIFGYVGTSTDIHESHLVTEELRRAERSLLLTTDAVPVLIGFVDRKLRYAFANRTFEAWFDRPCSELVGQRLIDLLDREGYEEVTPLMERALSGERLSFERWAQYPDGKRRFVHVEYVPRESDQGEIEGFYVLSTDLTERALQEEALEQKVRERTADLQAANEALQGFTYHVSHDLRAPLRAIASTSHMLREDYADELSPEAHGLLNRQAEAAGKLGRLIDDLLRFSRLSRGELTRTALDFTRLAHEARAETLTAHPDTAVQVEIAEGLSAEADPNLLRLALVNLVENAVKYSPEGGTVRVGQRIDSAFFVSDEGIGIEERYFEKIFEPFQRLHRDDEFKGTGIGLSNVRQIVTRHGGRVWVESEKGVGSTFLFTLG